MPMSVRETLEKGTEAFSTHDMDAFGETMSDDVVQIAPGGMRMQGREACTAFFAGWIEAFPDARVDVHDTVIANNAVVEDGTFSGTHDGVFHSPMGDVPPTGRSVSAEYVQVLRC
jgi:predicted ester cyclase